MGVPFLGREPALLEERPRGRVRVEIRAEERRREAQRLRRTRLLAAIHTRAAPPHRKRDAREPGQIRDRVREFEALGLPDERDRVPLRAAAEAVIETLVGMHVERRAFFGVERAQALPGAAGLLERGHRADELDEIRRGEDVALDVVRDVVEGLRHPASRW